MLIHYYSSNQNKENNSYQTTKLRIEIQISSKVSSLNKVL